MSGPALCRCARLPRSDQPGVQTWACFLPSWPPITHPSRSSPQSSCRRRRPFTSSPSPSSQHGHPIGYPGHSVARTHRGAGALLHKVRLSPSGQALPSRPRLPCLLGVPSVRLGPHHSVPVCTLQESPAKDARTVACTPRSSRARGHHHTPSSGSVVRRQAGWGARGRQASLGSQQALRLHGGDRKCLCHRPGLLCVGRRSLCPL